MLLRFMAREGGLHILIGILQATRGHQQLDLLLAHEGVEVAGKNVGAARFFDEVVEVKNLLLPRLVAKCQMDEEDCDLFKLQFDNEFFHAALKVVELFAADGVLRQKRIALLVIERDALPAGGCAVFGAIAMEVSQLLSHLLGLTLFAGAVGAVVHLDQSDYVGIERSDEFGDLGQMVVGSSQHSDQG